MKHFNLFCGIFIWVRPLHYRQNVYEIPPDAIRELIINAVVHRSYPDHGMIQVAVYDDRLEITSPGKLPMGKRYSKNHWQSKESRTAGIGGVTSMTPIVPDSADEMPDNTSKVPDSEQEQRIYKYVLENGSITTNKVMELFNVKQRRARVILQSMIDGYCFQFIGQYAVKTK